ncbi:MAG TPA: FHA domain-containing protein [Pirellulales bacterium]|nr:FHA domain-containing protein [Pirellulales bacterium]
MEVRLKVLVGKSHGQELAVPGPKFFIGRAEDCQLRPRSDLISRHHCALLIEDNFVAVRDFGSKNGTHVNGERVSGERELKAGDKLTIGPLEFEVCLPTAVSSKKRPKVESVGEAAARTAESPDERVDVSQWLTDKDQRVGVAETRVVNVNETSEIDVGESQVMGATKGSEKDQGKEGAQAESSAISSKKHVEKKAPGKLPVSAKDNSADSRTAAADVLNKFFKRR